MTTPTIIPVYARGRNHRNESIPTTETTMITNSSICTLTLKKTWARSGFLAGRLAAKADRGISYVTCSIPALEASGLLPHEHDLRHGDYLLMLLCEQLVLAKVNRRNHTTLAFHLPDGLTMPGSDVNPFAPGTYPVTLLGPLAGARIDLVPEGLPRLRIEDGEPSPSTEIVTVRERQNPASTTEDTQYPDGSLFVPSRADGAVPTSSDAVPTPSESEEQ